MVFLLTVGLTFCQKTAEQNFTKGVEYAAEGNFKKATKELEKVLRVEPTHKSAKRFLIIIKDVNEQKIQTKTAVSFFKGATYALKGQWDEAIGEYTKAMEIEPTYAMPYISRGNAYVYKDQYDQAIIDFNKAIEVNPKFVKAYTDRGLVHMEQLGNKQKACSDWKRACELGECYHYTIGQRNGDCE